MAGSESSRGVMVAASVPQMGGAYRAPRTNPWRWPPRRGHVNGVIDEGPMAIRVLCGVAALMLGAPAAAQPNIDYEGLWTVTLGASLSRATGNTDATSVALQATRSA